MLTEWLLLLVGIVLTLGTAVFVAAEFAFVTLDRFTVEKAVEDGDRRAAGVLPALRTLSTQLSGAQVGITLTTLLVGYLTEPSLASLLHGPLSALGLGDGLADTVAGVVSVVVAAAFSMVVGELIPKNLALSVPLRTAGVVAPLQRGFTWFTGPLITVLNGSANWFLRRIGVEPQEELSGARSARELAALVRRSADLGTLDEGTANLISRSLLFGDQTAADVMTPRVRMEVVRLEETAADVVARARTTGHSRFPVTGDDDDDVRGVVHVKAAVAVPPERRHDVPAAALMSTARRVPDSLTLEPLLVQLRQKGLQLAVVVDEYGGTAGVVTLEDLVEEIVGDVSDEHDRDRGGLRQHRDSSWTVPGLARPDEVRDACGVDVPDDPAYETVGGFVMARLGRIPAVGDEVEIDGAVLRVARMEGRRVERLRLRPRPVTVSEAVSGAVSGAVASAGGAR
ncbi:hemolysin family protein [Kineococcus rhizosphaerae]|uniref:CBS domain containing-hemolysin-like protein n=1 Tax=Kineococcus rhizosphaerae TaxID=559628 RepID=A0A2T0QYW3_9ACTN|nr:hemolysin family protein [Kineococcus rhizosphaerae]PRY11718.1 CBS domain containing-hemolysin-like protein [Kineococcus rhizosphaerae]